MSAATQLRKDAAAIADQAPVLHQHSSLATALVAALADLCVIGKGRTVSTGTYSYDYADLADVVTLTRPVLAHHGLVALTPVQGHGDGLSVSVVILHTSGERFVTEPLTFPHGRDAQATGSWITYMRRYALVAALGMAAGDDDDGAAAKAAPQQVWNRAVAKQHVSSRVGPQEAPLAWEFGSGDDITEWSQAKADELVDAWLGRPMVDEPAPALPLGET